MTTSIEQQLLPTACSVDMTSAIGSYLPPPLPAFSTSTMSDLCDPHAVQYSNAMYNRRPSLALATDLSSPPLLSDSAFHANGIDNPVDAQHHQALFNFAQTAAASIQTLPLDSSQLAFASHMAANSTTPTSTTALGRTVSESLRPMLPVTSQRRQSMSHSTSPALDHLQQDSFTSNSNARPTIPYSSIITHAIEGSASRQLTLNGIYNFAMEQYPYFKTAGSGWKNSIRHNLSLNKNFVRVARPANERGKGAYWTLSSTSFPKKGRSRHRSVSDPNRGIAQGIISSMKNGDGTSPLESGHGTPVSQFEAISNQQSMLSQQSQSGQLQSQQLGYHLIPTELFPRGSPDFTAGMNSFDKHQTMMDPLRSFQDNLNSTSISGSTSIHTLDNIGAIHTSIGQLANTAAVNGEPIGQGRHPSLLRRHTYQNGRTLPPEIVGLRRTLDGNIQFGSSGLFESEYDNTVANGAMNQGMTTPVAGTTATMETATSPTALANAAVAHSAMQQRFARARSASFHYLPGFFPSQLSYHDLGLAHGNNQVMYDSHGAMHDPKYINEIITEEEGHTMQSGAMFQPNFFNGDPSNLIKSDANNLNVRVNPTGVVGSGGFNNQQQTWLGAPSQEHSYNDLSMTAFPDTNSSVGLINPSISQQSTAGYFSYQRNASDLEGLSELPEESEVTNIYNMKPNDRQSIGAGVAATSAATTFNEQRRNTVSAMPDQSGFPMNLQRRTSFQQGTPMSQFALPGHIAQPPQLTEGLAGVPGRLELGQRGNAEGYSWEGYA